MQKSAKIESRERETIQTDIFLPLQNYLKSWKVADIRHQKVVLSNVHTHETFYVVPGGEMCLGSLAKNEYCPGVLFATDSTTLYLVNQSKTHFF